MTVFYCSRVISRRLTSPFHKTLPFYNISKPSFFFSFCIKILHSPDRKLSAISATHLSAAHVSRQKNFSLYSALLLHIYMKLISRLNRWTVPPGTLITYLMIFKVFLSLLRGLPFTQPKDKENGPVVVFNYLYFDLPLRSGRWVLTYNCSQKEQKS